MTILEALYQAVDKINEAIDLLKISEYDEDFKKIHIRRLSIEKESIMKEAIEEEIETIIEGEDL